MRFSVLSSGSKANSTFIEVGSQRILIDCGLSAKQTSIRLLELGIDPESINAMIITHEHSDHVRGISVMSRKYSIPVFANEETAQFLDNIYALETFVTGQKFCLNEVEISPFSIVHDAVDPVGFVLEAEGLKFAQATDLGRVTPLVRESLRGAHALVLESNHDLDMLQESQYPWELKQRIASSHGHLSNDTAGNLLFELFHHDMFQVVLGHLSENCNTPQLAVDTVKRYVNDITHTVPNFALYCGSVNRQTDLFTVGEEQSQQQLVG
ncbi:MAG: MBL fold metallo-hydrolase [Deltaproteobacteria bacterium]|nr:MBL fold metallo-hydrolase [Deltaproteobacteria bacterium]